MYVTIVNNDKEFKKNKETWPLKTQTITVKRKEDARLGLRVYKKQCVFFDLFQLQM